MKEKKITALLMIAVAFIMLNFEVQAQEEGPMIISVTRSHWNMDYKDFSMDEWKKVETEYHEKVIMKNEFIEGANVLLHYYTPDNSEILFVNVFSSWENIEKATRRNGELAREAWPDQEARRAFFDKQGAYYAEKHSDEIYSSLPFAKQLSEKSTEPLVYYVRTIHAVWPEDGNIDEIRSMQQEFTENVYHKLNNLLAYYPMRHLYGADSRERLQVFVFKSLSDLDAMDMQDLIEAHWPDEDSREAFFNSFSKYQSPWHGDLIYRNVPELVK